MRHTATFFLACAFCGLFAGGTAAAEAICGWSAHDADIDYLLDLVEVGATEYGINHLQLMRKRDGYGIGMDPAGPRADELRRLAERCHKLGVKLYLWVWELSGEVPDEFMVDGQIAAVDPGFWDWMRRRYERFLDAMPQLDGLILTLRESPKVMHLSDDIVWPGSKPQLVAKIIATIYQACEPRGVDLYVRTFSVTPSETRILVDGIRLSPPGVAVMTKCVARDWHSCLPSHPALGDFPDRTQIVEFDLTGEYSGQGLVPYCLPEYIKQRWDYARQRGAAGACGRIDRFENHCLGTLNEVNAWALARYVRDEHATPQQVWDEWVKRRFGEGGRETIETVLRLTPRIVDEILYVKRFKFLNDHSCVPSLSYADSHISSASLGIWIPGLRTVEAELRRPNAQTLEEALAEKRDAIALCNQALAQLDFARNTMSPEAYDELSAAFTRLRDMAGLYLPMTEAYLRLRMIRNGDVPPDDPGFAKAAADMQKTTETLEEKYGPNLHFGRKDMPPGEGLGRARRLLAEMKSQVASRRAVNNQTRTP